MSARPPGVLVTRAEPGASDTARRLAALGYDPVLAPLLEIVPDRAARIELSGAQALLLTSANGARALAGMDARIDPGLPALCVGAATAEAAREAGFADARAAEGDAGALAVLARAALDPAKGALVWASGEDVSQDMAALLAPAGFDVRRAVVYRAAPAQALPDIARAALERGALSAVLFHSARAADAFAGLARASGTTRFAAGLAAVCISTRVAAAAQALVWGRVVTAERPEEAMMFPALERALASDNA